MLTLLQFLEAKYMRDENVEHEKRVFVDELLYAVRINTEEVKCTKNRLTAAVKNVFGFNRTPVKYFGKSGKQKGYYCGIVKRLELELSCGSASGNVCGSILLEQNDRCPSDAASLNTDKDSDENILRTPNKKDDHLLGVPDSGVEMEWLTPNMRIGCGLENLGNTCYMNATLQCLAYTCPLYNFLVQDDHKEKCVVQGYCVACNVHDFLPSMLWNPTGFLSPTEIAENIAVFASGLTRGRQEDAHEFLRLLINALQDCLLFDLNGNILDNSNSDTTFISRIFGGVYRSRIVCLRCQQFVDVYESFMDIPLDIGQNIGNLSDALKMFVHRKTPL